ncbi:MAG: hypothetical protein IJA86_02275 [Clostridia bacterium]|nr:hypothetical protein [Clostridia bacterium]
MILDIIGDIPTKEGLLLRINGIEKEITSTSKKVRFQFPDEKEYTVYFKQKKKRTKNPFFSLLFFLLTALIQGFVNILGINESAAWYRNLQPYLIKGKFTLQSQKEMTIALKYLPSKYLDDIQTWSKPQLIVMESDRNTEKTQWKVLTEEQLTVRYEKDISQFHSRFRTYVKKVISTALIWFLLFSILLVAAHLKEIFIGEIVLSILLLGIFGISAFLIAMQYKKKKILLSNFLNRED